MTVQTHEEEPPVENPSTAGLALIEASTEELVRVAGSPFAEAKNSLHATLDRSWELRKDLAEKFFGSGVGLVVIANAITLGVFLCSLSGLLDGIENVYQASVVIVKGIAIAIFDFAVTFAGVALIRAAERMTLPLGMEAEQVHAFTANRRSKNVLDKEQLELVATIMKAAVK